MRRARTLAVALAAAASALAGSGCGDFQDPSTVLDLRVLAIDTEPSEIILDTAVDLTTSPPTITVDPTSDLAFAVQPLLPDPSGGPVTWTLVACPNNPFGAAPPSGGGGAAMLGGARLTVGSSLCPDDPALTWPLVTEADGARAGETRTVRVEPDDLVTAFTRDIYVDQYGNYHGGFDLGEPLALQLTATDGVNAITAIKRVLFWANRISPDQVANHTPLVPAVITYPDRDPATFEPAGAVTPLIAGDAQVVQAGGTLWVQPILAEGTAEPYVTTVIDPDTRLAIPDHVARERLRYAFYATAGTFTPARTNSELPPGFVAVGPHPIHLESKYTAPLSLDGLPADEQQRAQVTVWIVVRDERGGESWAERQLLIAPPL